MQNSTREITPIEYGEAGIKALNYSMTAGQNCFRLHWHDRMELIKIRHGSMKVNTGDGEILIEQNEVYIIPPKVPHTAVANSDVEYDVIMFDIRSFYNDTPLSERYLEPIFNGTARFVIKTDDAAAAECYDLILGTLGNDSLLCTSLIYRFIGLLYKNCLTEIDNSTRSDSVISTAVKYIEENFSEGISTESLSKRFGYSSAHFCRKFKEETWLTPMNYLKIFRLETSAKLLKQKKHSINEISALCGFDDANYFTRCFKSHFGVPPTKYLK